MTKNKKIKAFDKVPDTLVKARNYQQLQEESQNKKITLGFSCFKAESVKNDKYTFNNHYSSLSAFLKNNGELFEVFSRITKYSAKDILKDVKIKEDYKFKLLDRPETLEKIMIVLKKCYSVPEKTLEQWRENKYIECGVNSESRFIGMLMEENKIEVFFLDPNHLICPDERYPIKYKMKYDYPQVTRRVNSKKEIDDEFKKVCDAYYNEKKEELLDYFIFMVEDIRTGRCTDINQIIELYDSYKDEYGIEDSTLV